MWDHAKILEEMEKRMLVPDMCQDMLKNLDDKFLHGEDKYQEAKKALNKLLPKNKLEVLKETEEEGMRFLLYCIGIAFKRGLYTGFEHIFSPAPETNDFEKRIDREFLELPKMETHTEYYEWHIKLENMFKRLDEIADTCGDITYEHMKTIDSVWDNRPYLSFRYGYYMGYKYALSLAQEVDPDMKYTAAMFVTLFKVEEFGFKTFDEKLYLLDKLIESYDTDVQTQKALSDLMRLI